MPALLLTSFGDASEQQVLENWKVFCINHFVRLFISAYKYAIFHQTLRLNQADDICIFSPKDSVELSKRLTELLRLAKFQDSLGSSLE